METNKNEVVFLVQGSQPDPYKVTFSKNGDNLRGLCNCKAATNGMACKHRLDILTGDKKATATLDQENVKLVQKWLKGSDVERIPGRCEGSKTQPKPCLSGLVIVKGG